MLLPDVSVGKRLQVGLGKPFPLGVGKKEIRGSAYIQGPMIFGSSTYWKGVGACVMLAPLTNPESPKPSISGSISACGSFNSSPYTLGVYGPTAMFDELDVNDKIIAADNIQSGGDIIAAGEVKSQCGGHVLSRKKNIPFDMEHPTKKGWRLRHVCLEGPEIGVYIHGKGKGNILEMPDYWKGLVREHTISVHLTPIGHPYVLYVEKIEDNKVYIGSNISFSDEEIEYNYVLHASRYDDDLIVEYEGTSHLDYPGGNEGYSFTFENDNMERLVKEVAKERILELEKLKEKENGN